MNTYLRKKAKNDFQKDFFSLMNNSVFRKPIEKWENGDIKLVTTERRKNYLVSKPNDDTTNFFTGNLLATKMKKIDALLNTGSPVFFRTI